MRSVRRELLHHHLILSERHRSGLSRAGDIFTDVAAFVMKRSPRAGGDPPEQVTFPADRQRESGKRDAERHVDAGALSDTDICTLQYVALLGCDHPPKY